jgi:hypothetical protein
MIGARIDDRCKSQLLHSAFNMLWNYVERLLDDIRGANWG